MTIASFKVRATSVTVGQAVPIPAVIPGEEQLAPKELFTVTLTPQDAKPNQGVFNWLVEDISEIVVGEIYTLNLNKG
jgi:hypothetical protein